MAGQKWLAVVNSRRGLSWLCTYPSRFLVFWLGLVPVPELSTKLPKLTESLQYLKSPDEALSMIPTLLPAYGRDYKSKKEILSDLNDDKDFILSGLRGGYINKPQLISEGMTNVVIRYNKQMKVTSVKLKKDGTFAW